jgi:hypothetical protein
VLVCSERKILLAGCWWLVCCERKILLAGCWWLVCCERKVLLAGDGFFTFFPLEFLQTYSFCFSGHAYSLISAGVSVERFLFESMTMPVPSCLVSSEVQGQ